IDWLLGCYRIFLPTVARAVHHLPTIQHQRPLRPAQRSQFGPAGSDTRPPLLVATAHAEISTEHIAASAVPICGRQVGEDITVAATRACRIEWSPVVAYHHRDIGVVVIPPFDALGEAPFATSVERVGCQSLQSRGQHPYG